METNKQTTKVFELTTERKYTCLARLLTTVNLNIAPESVIIAVDDWVNSQLWDIARDEVSLEKLINAIKDGNPIVISHLDSDEVYKVLVMRCDKTYTIEILYSKSIDVVIKPF